MSGNDGGNRESEFPEWVIKRSKVDTGGELPPDFPLIIDDSSGEICQVPLLYLADQHLTRTRTLYANTVGARGPASPTSVQQLTGPGLSNLHKSKGLGNGAP